MVEAPQHSGRKRIAVLKVSYLLAVTAVAFAVPAFAAARPSEWIVVPALLALQAFTLLACRIEAREVARPVLRLKWLFVFLMATYLLLPPERSTDSLVEWRIPAIGWPILINLTGLEHAGLMCLQILTVILASALVRLTGTGSDLAEGLEAFHLPRLFVYSLDRTLELLGGMRRQGSRGQRNSGPRPGFLGVMKQLLRGDVGSFVRTIQRNINLASERTEQHADGHIGSRMTHDVAVISGIALCMASLKMLKLFPGLPFASGHKALLLFPLYVLASRLTHSRWGGTAAGSVMGVIGFLQGDGRFGVLEILKQLAPGLVIDIADPLVRRLPRWALGYCLLGLLAAVARTSTEFGVVLMLGARAEVYLFPAAKLIPNLLAGFLSGFVTMFVLRAFRLSNASNDSDPQTRAGAASLDPPTPAKEE